MAAVSPMDPARVRNQVERITASELFRRAERQCRFLRYIVDHHLDGQSDRLKGYSIGVDVFDREQDFDPNLDSIVRVEAGRLRSKLRDYYHDSGQDDEIHIEMPRGTYAPRISRRIPGSRAQVVAATAILPRKRATGSVAVLPFRNLSGNPGEEYISDGITDAVITELARNPHLKVISLTSVMRFKNTGRSIPDIATELNVKHVLEGTLLREGKRIRVTAQLIEAGPDLHVWAEAFERDVKGMFAVQRDLAEKIHANLAREILPAPDQIAAGRIDPRAYEIYLLGRGYRRRLTREGLLKAADCFRQAIQLDMNFAAAYAGAASCYCALGSYGFELQQPKEIIPTGLEYSRRALAMDPDLVESITFTAIMTLKYEWNWDEARRLFRQALAISPNDARAHLQYSLWHESVGDHDTAIDEAEQARNIDPLSAEANMNLAWQLHQAGRHEEALVRFNWSLDLNPGFWGAHWGKGHVYLALGRFPEAIDAFRSAEQTGGGYAMPLQGLGHAFAVAGEVDAALAVVEKLRGMESTSGYVSPCCAAAIYAGLGEADHCFAHLERAFECRSRSLAWLTVAREYASLRTDPRFADLVRRIGIPAPRQAGHPG